MNIWLMTRGLAGTLVFLIRLKGPGRPLCPLLIRSVLVFRQLVDASGYHRLQVLQRRYP